MRFVTSTPFATAAPSSRHVYENAHARRVAHAHSRACVPVGVGVVGVVPRARARRERRSARVVSIRSHGARAASAPALSRAHRHDARERGWHRR